MTFRTITPIHIITITLLKTLLMFFGQGRGLSAESPSAKPDLLLIMPDQMRGDCLSILGHPAVRTPELDRLAAEGALFRRAYSTVPSCIPARHALLTGLSPQTSGVVGYMQRPLTAPTMPALLGKAGYFTVLVGRNMHQHPESGSCGYDREILGSTHVSYDGYDAFLKEHSPETGGMSNLVKTLGLSNNGWQAKPWPLKDSLHPTSWIVSQSRAVLKQADAARPLFLTTSFYAPHPPLFPPKTYFDRYRRSDLPGVARGDWVDWKALSTKGDRVGQRVLLEGDTLRNAQAGYFGLIEHLDHEIGPLIREFKARSERAGRPWAIAFTADHGEMLGDHGYFRKCEPYEGSANIPFLISGSPELKFKAGLRSEQPVCLEDLMPTLLALANVPRPAPMDGINLVPTLRGGEQPLRPWLHFEHAPCYSQAQAFHALTDGRFKYIWRPADGAEQLFDLKQDPREVHDLSKDPEPGLTSWRARLVERLADRPEGFSKDGKLIPGRHYAPLNAGTKTHHAAAVSVDQVVPIKWTRFHPPQQRDEDCRRAAALLLNSARCNLAWSPSAAERIEREWAALSGRQNHDVIRPACDAAYALAVALKTGIYDPAVTDVPETEATTRTLRLIRAAAVAHDRKSWKYPWQSALWAAALAHAGWLLWDDLDSTTRQLIVEIALFEADRFLAADSEVPYWNGKNGDTKAEENAWNSMILQVAAGMMPRHSHAQRWRQVCSELMVSSYARPQDRQLDTVLDGRPVKDWLKGYNATEVGAVINHDIIHPDYILCVRLKLQAYLTQSLAGGPVPETAAFNAPEIYRMLITHKWPSPPCREPGGTIYAPGRAEMYYPQGTDWHEDAVNHAYLLDVYAHLLGWDAGLGGAQARSWMRLRAEKLLALQLRHTDRCLFTPADLKKYPGREQGVAADLANAFLLQWIHASGALSAAGNWLDTDQAAGDERLRISPRHPMGLVGQFDQHL